MTRSRSSSRSRGELDTARTAIPTPSRSQTWSLDALGNSNRVETFSGSGIPVTETRSHNAVNEIIPSFVMEEEESLAAPAAEGASSDDGSIVLANNDSHAPSLREALRWLLPRYRQQSGRAGLTLDQFARLLGLDPDRLDDPAPPPAGNSTGSSSTGDAGSLLLLLPTTFYDDAGNMIVNPHDTTRTYVYDAWNRMVWAGMSGLTGIEMVASYEYDGRGFRIEQSVPGKSAPVVTHDYLNDNWQVIEQRVGSSTSAWAQFVWSAAYVDALVQEQRDTDANGSLDRTLYATHDDNFNVTAAVTLGGIAQQRFLYDAYGARSVLAFDWQPTLDALPT